MQGILHWLFASPLRAGLAAAVLALSRLFDMFGAGLIALVALRKGAVAGLQAMAAGLSLIGLAGVIGGAGLNLPVAVSLFWLPVLVLSLVLRRTGSLALAMQAGVGLTGLALLGWYVSDPDPLATVADFLDRQVLPILQRMSGQAEMLAGPRRDTFLRLAPGMMAAGSLTIFTLALVIGRWWQAIAWNPGGFRQDFHRLRQGRSAVIVVALLVTAAMLTGQPVVIGLALTAVVTLVFQGIALVHGVVAATAQPPAWLWGMYAALILLPSQATILLALAGGLDNWVDFRRLAGQGAVKPNE